MISKLTKIIEIDKSDIILTKDGNAFFFIVFLMGQHMVILVDVY